eukprot:GFYU01034692.1.p1 GENE.GFYU01034692.1~~GFYU01034692.1.p1  ORF type:complete len:120 (-),score=46.60 GFYU01034692.1:32-391(-)
MVRVYLLNGLNLAPKDDGGASDPFLTLKLGKENIDDKENKLEETLQPEFYRSFEMKCLLPGPSRLTVDVYDWDILGANDLIGSTHIDVENRLFNKKWDTFKKKPVEARSLWSPASSNAQ